MTVNGSPMRLSNSSTVYQLWQRFDLRTYFPGSMENAIHISGGPHKINTLEQQKQEKTKEWKSHFNYLLYKNTSIFHFGVLINEI